MFGSSTTTVTLSALLSLAAVQLVHADPVPSEPAPGEVFTEGKSCHIAWSPDTTGQWKSMNIELMTGPNDAMIHLTTVANVDATGDTTSFDYTCPTVSLHSAVYFYQFTSPASSNISWTGRFTITDSTGTTVDPPNSTVIDGSTINWGTGALTNASQPVSTASGATSSAATSSASSAAVTSETASASATSTKKISVTSTASGVAAAATSSKASTTNNTSSESTSGAMEGRKVQVTLGMVAVLGSIAAFL